jgi:hypothetical protein
MEIEVARVESKALPPPARGIPLILWRVWEVSPALGKFLVLCGFLAAAVLGIMGVTYGFITMEGYRGPFFGSDVIAWSFAFSVIPLAIGCRFLVMMVGGQSLGGFLGGMVRQPNEPPPPEARTANDAYDGGFDDRPKPKGKVVGDL